MAAPQVVKNTSIYPIKILDFTDFDGFPIIIAPGATLDLFTKTSDETIAKSPHIRHLVELGIFQVVTSFLISDTQASATTGVLDVADAAQAAADLADANAALARAGSDGLRSATTIVNTSDAAAPTAGQVLTAIDDTSASWADPSTGSGGHVIQDEGVSVASRAKLNFVGSGVAVTNPISPADETTVTISGAGVTFVDLEEVAGLTDGVNATFTLSAIPTGNSLHLFVNGILQRAGGNDYTLTGSSILMITAPTSGSVILASYRI